MKILLPIGLALLCLLVTSSFRSRNNSENHLYEAETAGLVKGASKIASDSASGGYMVRLGTPGDGIIFKHLPGGSKFAIRYSASGTGLVGVTINNQPVQQINIHSSGDPGQSFLHSIIDITIPADATLSFSLAASDSIVYIDQIIIGKGDLGMQPDIWNLPALPVANGPFPADWKGLSRTYTAPAWWRDAKFGA